MTNLILWWFSSHKEININRKADEDDKQITINRMMISEK